MILKNYKQFINEEKEDIPGDHYHDNQMEKLESQIKEFNRSKSKLDLLIKKYDYSENSDRNLNKIINSNPLLIQYWSILKKKKRVVDLNEKIDELRKDIILLKKDEDTEEQIKKKQEKINSNREEINNIEKENKELEKQNKENEKETKKKIDYLKNKLVK